MGPKVNKIYIKELLLSPIDVFYSIQARYMYMDSVSYSDDVGLLYQ